PALHAESELVRVEREPVLLDPGAERRDLPARGEDRGRRHAVEGPRQEDERLPVAAELPRGLDRGGDERLRAGSEDELVRAHVRLARAAEELGARAPRAAEELRRVGLAEPFEQAVAEALRDGELALAEVEPDPPRDVRRRLEGGGECELLIEGRRDGVGRDRRSARDGARPAV